MTYNCSVVDAAAHLTRKDAMAQVKEVQCPHCRKQVRFEKGEAGRWVGTIVGGGAGYGLAFKLGIAGTVLGAPIAIPAAIVGVVVCALLGNRVGAMVDNPDVQCPNCKKYMSI